MTGSRWRALAKKIETITRQDKATDDVDDVMLISQHRGKTNENEPNIGDSHESREFAARKDRRGSNSNATCNDGKQIEWRIHSAKPIEDRAEPSIGVRPRKCKTQRKKQKANSGDQDRSRHSPRKYAQLSFVRQRNGAATKNKSIDM